MKSKLLAPITSSLWRSPALAAYCALALSLGGCSLSMFGNGQDEAVKESSGYREISNACSGIELSGTTLDVPAFRGLLRCFNSNGALDPIDRLVTALTDTDLEPLVDTLNKSVLQNKTLLFKLETTHQMLSDQGLLDSTLKQLGRLTENEEFVASAIALLKEGYFSGGSGGARLRQPDRHLLLALERIATKLSYQNTEEGIDAALNLATSKAFLDLQTKFKHASPAGRSLRQITDGALEHLRDFEDPDHVLVGRELITSLINGDLFQGLDAVVGTSVEDMRRGIPRMSAVLRVLLANDGRIFNGLTSLFHYASKPLECVRGGATVADPAYFILGELSRITPQNAASFIKRDNLLSLAAMNPFCNFPPELASGYPLLMALADTNAIRPATELIQAFYGITRDGDRPMARLLINLLADTGSGAYAGAPAENTSGIKRIIPLLAEFQDRGVWDDLLLVANLVDLKHRKNLADFLLFLVTPAPELGGKSIYDVLTNVILRTRPVDLYNFVHSLRRFTAEDDLILAPALTSLRSAYYANDVHPILDLAHQILSTASSNERFFSTLFMISEMPEFRDSLKLVSKMAKDGRLKTLLGSLLAVFHKSAQEGYLRISATTEPPFIPNRRHNLSSADLVPFEIIPEPSNANNACLKIDLSVNLGEHTHPDFEGQLKNVAQCVNSASGHSDFEEALEFLTSEKLNDGRSALAYHIDLIRQLGLSQRESKHVIDIWKKEYDGGRFLRLLDAVPFWFSKKADAKSDSLSQLLLKGLNPLLPEGLGPLDRLGQFGGAIVRDREFPRLLGFINRLIPADNPAESSRPTPVRVRPEDHFDDITNAVGAYECEADPARREARARAIIGDYRDSITSWELVGGQQRREWKKEEFESKTRPLINKLADPLQSIESKNILSALLEFMKFYSLEPGGEANAQSHRPPEYLGKWLKERSNDFQLIPYFFTDERGKIQHRLRLVNSLDRFELVLINSDFKAPVLGTNFGLQFLAQIGEAWGDEPEATWPPEIRAKFKKGKRPQTLREAYNDIAKTQRLFEKLMGFPKTPKCANRISTATPRRNHEDDLELEATPEMMSFLDGLTGDGKKQIQASLFNIRQVLAVIEQNLPGSGHPVFDGGMRVFRDLFYQIYYSTPEGFRGARAGDSNNLSFVMWIARMGAARQMGRLFFDTNTTDSELKDFMEGLVQGSTAQGIEPALRLILSQPKHPLIWNTLNSILDLKDPEAIRSTKGSVFHAVASARQLNLIPAAVALFPPLLESYREFFGENVSTGLELLASPRLAGFLETLYKNDEADVKLELQRLLHSAVEKPELALDGLFLLKTLSDSTDAQVAWKAAWNRLQELKKIPEYPHEALSTALRDLIRFLSDGASDPSLPPPSPDARETAARLRLYLADRLEKGDLLPLLELALKNPVKFNQVLETLGRHLENGDLREFFALLRRGL